MGIRALTEAEYEIEGAPALSRIYRDVHPADAVLQPGVEAAAIVYPLNELSRAQLETLAAAALAAGDNALYLTVLDKVIAGIATDEHGLLFSDKDLVSLTENWYLPLDAIADYENVRLNATLDYALHSPEGRWGILVAHEGYAVVAGTAVFVTSLLDSLTLDEAEMPTAESVNAWLRDTRLQQDAYHDPTIGPIRFVPRLTVSVYGRDRARQLLSANGWADSGV